MAPRRGLEPPTYRLTAECSTIELSRNVITNIIITGLIIFATLFIELISILNFINTNVQERGTISILNLVF